MTHYEVDVNLLGKTFSFTLPQTLGKQRFYEIVEYVEQKFKSIRDEMDELDPFKVALLASLNVTEELLGQKEENQKLRALLSRIDRTLDDCETDKDLTIRLGGTKT